MTKNKVLYFLAAVIAIAALVLIIYAFPRPHRATNAEAKTSVAEALSKKYHFSITRPSGTNAYELEGGCVCSDSPDGMWNGSVEVTTTTTRNVQEVVDTNNQKLALTDSAYMQVVRETTVDNEPAIIVKQTFGSEGGADIQHPG